MQARKRKLLDATRKGKLQEFCDVVKEFNAENGERAAILNSGGSPGEPNPLLGASSFGHTSIVSWILSDSGGRAAGFTNVLARFSSDPLASHLAVESGYLACLQAIVQGCKVENGERDKMLNSQMMNGFTLLHLAASNGHEPVIRWLLSEAPGGGRTFGFKSVLTKTRDAETALLVAAKNQHLLCCKAIVEGCKPQNGERDEMLNAVGADKLSVLHILALQCPESIVTWLLSDTGGRALGFKNIFAKTHTGATALRCAVQRGDLPVFFAIVNGLKEQNGERAKMLNTLENEGLSILDIAASKGHKEIITWLLSDSGGRAAGFNRLFPPVDDAQSCLYLTAAMNNEECFHAIVNGYKVENGERAKLLNTTCHGGATILHVAPTKAAVKIVTWLLSDSGGRAAGFSKILVRDYRGLVALHLAAEYGHLPTFHAIVKGCKVENGEQEQMLNSVTDRGFTVLHIAASRGRELIVKWLLSDSGGRACGFNKILAKAEGGMTALHIAINQGHPSCIHALITLCKKEGGEKGELFQMLNIEDSNNISPAALLEGCGQSSLVQQLLSDIGKQPDPAPGRKAAAPAAAAATASPPASKKDDGTALRLAAREGNLPTLQKLVSGYKGGEQARMLNSCDSKGHTILHHAASSGQEAVVKWILSDSGGRAAGFDSAIAKSTGGWTALHCCAVSGDFATFEALVNGCKEENGERRKLLNTIDTLRRTVLHLAAANGQFFIVQWLLSPNRGQEAGFNAIFAKTSTGMTAAQLAAAHGRLKCVQAILNACKRDDQNLIINSATDNDNSTMLHLAALEGHEELAKWILSESGGRKVGFRHTLAKDRHAYTAFHIAASSGHVSCFKSLLKNCTAEEREQLFQSDAAEKGEDSLLNAAVLSNKAELVSWLLSPQGGRAIGFQSENVTLKWERGHSILHSLAGHGAINTIQALLAGCTAGEKLKLFLFVDKFQFTILHHAARLGDADMIRELLLNHEETKTIVDARDRRGMTALHRAVLDGGVDSTSKKEWKSRVDERRDAETRRLNVIEALLTAPDVEEGEEETEEQKRQARLDVNLGVKVGK